jgi:hypothetical protein
MYKIYNHYYKSWFFLIACEIDQKGPKSDTSRLDQGAILDKSISTMSILTNGLFDYLYLVILISEMIGKVTDYLISKHWTI